MQCKHRRGKELGESGRLYALDQTKKLTEFMSIYCTIGSANRNSECNDSKSDSEVVEQHGGGKGPKSRLVIFEN